MELIDSHAHIQADFFENEFDAVVSRAKEAGVIAVVNIGTSLKESKEVIDISAQYPGFMYPTVGLHPEDAEADFKQFSLNELKHEFVKLAQTNGVVAIGECGLDYGKVYEVVSAEQIEHQKLIFTMQAQVAQNLHLPLAIHCRNAWDDTFSILNDYPEVTTIFHSFTGDVATAKRGIERDNIYFSFSGILTFKSAKAIQEAARIIPHDRVLIESDSPFLSPVPVRGSRNEPKNICSTATFLANLLGTKPEDLAKITVVNTKTVFGLSL